MKEIKKEKRNKKRKKEIKKRNKKMICLFGDSKNLDYQLVLDVFVNRLS